MADSHAIENWRPVVGYEGLYEVSDLGRVRSIARTARVRGGGERPVRERTLRIALRHGYPAVGLSRNGIRGMRQVHALVLSAFRGARPDGMQGCHNNGAKTDVRLSNLRWDTPKGNTADKVAHGTFHIGERHGLAKLTDDAVRVIFRMQAEGMSQRKIAAHFGVDRGAVQQVLKRKTWTHVEVDRGS